MNPVFSSKWTCQKEKNSFLKENKQHIYSLSPIHSWNISEVPFKIPVLLISASHWAKQGVHMHATRWATSYLVTYAEGSGSFDPYFIFCLNTRAMTDANRRCAGEISQLTFLFPPYLPTSWDFPSLPASFPTTLFFFLIGFTFTIVQFHCITRKQKMWRDNNTLFSLWIIRNFLGSKKMRICTNSEVSLQKIKHFLLPDSRRRCCRKFYLLITFTGELQ